MNFILSIDQGTTGTTSALIDTQNFKIICQKNQEYPQIYPAPGLVEHNLDDIWQTVENTVSEIIKEIQITPEQIKCIGITNQRETVCAFSKDGKPLTNAIVWQDRRTSEFCKSLKEKEKFIRERTGLPIDPYFSATKIRWLLNNDSEVKKAYKNNNLLFGTVDTYLLYKLTGNQSYKTEASNASRTLLMNIESGTWDDEMLKLFEIDKLNLAKICDSFGDFGKTKGLDFLSDGIPITGMLGDQQAAMLGQGCVNIGDAKCTYGTGAFLLFQTGTELKRSSNGLLTTAAFQRNGQIFYALEGSCYIAGAAVQWLRDNLNIIESSLEIEHLARKVENLSEMDNLLFLPFFTGIGTPYWNSEAKAAIIGITRDTAKKHIAKACLDGISFSVDDLIKVIETELKLKINTLKVDGGVVQNNLLLETQATVSDIEILRPEIMETTVYGAGLAAAVGNGLIPFEDIGNFWKLEKNFHKDLKTSNFYKKKKEQWNEIMQRIY